MKIGDHFSVITNADQGVAESMAILTCGSREMRDQFAIT